MSVSVCDCACPRAYLRKCASDFHQICLYMLSVAVARFSSGGGCDTLCASGFIDGVIYLYIIKSSPYSITERRVPELIPVLGSQPEGDTHYTHTPV